MEADFFENAEGIRERVWGPNKTPRDTPTRETGMHTDHIDHKACQERMRQLPFASLLFIIQDSDLLIWAAAVQAMEFR